MGTLTRIRSLCESERKFTYGSLKFRVQEYDTGMRLTADCGQCHVAIDVEGDDYVYVDIGNYVDWLGTRQLKDLTAFLGEFCDSNGGYDIGYLQQLVLYRRG